MMGGGIVRVTLPKIPLAFRQAEPFGLQACGQIPGQVLASGVPVNRSAAGPYNWACCVLLIYVATDLAFNRFNKAGILDKSHSA